MPGAWQTAGTTQQTNFNVTGLSPQTGYDFQVIASNSAGTSSPSSFVSATTSAPTVGVPSQVQGVSAGNATNTTITVSWQAPSSGNPVNGYCVQVKPHTVGAFDSVSPVTPGVGSFKDAAGDTVAIDVTGKITFNGMQDTPTANVVQAFPFGGAIWQQNTDGNWYSESQNNDSWTQAARAPSSLFTIPVITPGVGMFQTFAKELVTVGTDAKIYFNGVADAPTQGVTWAAYISNNIWQQNNQGNYYFEPANNDTWQQVTGATPWTVAFSGLTKNTGYDFQVFAFNGAGAGPVSTTATLSTTNQAGSGVFAVSNGQILDPDGNVFRARGITASFLNWPDNPQVELGLVYGNAQGQPATTIFPRHNFVRIPMAQSVKQLYGYGPNDVFPGAGNVTWDQNRSFISPTAVYPLIDRITALGIVCELEYHMYDHVLQGAELTDVCTWYGIVAAHYKNEPHVWFGAQNEPPGNVDGQNVAIYNAVRNAGNNGPFLVTIGGGTNLGGMTSSNYTNMVNIVGDQHFYGWTSNWSTDQATVNNNLAGFISAFHNIVTSKDGVVPLIVGEFGPAGYNAGGNTGFYGNDANHDFNTYGNGWYDNNWSQVLNAVYNSPSIAGWAQWWWNTPDMTQDGSIDHYWIETQPPTTTLTTAGKALQTAIANG